MIQTQDRTMWFGASDTDKIVGNRNTKTWERWWAEKLGIMPNCNFQNKYTRAGTQYEHEILRSLGLPIVYDHQIRIPELSLRVNYDGLVMPDEIYEVKTYNEEKEFKVSKTYWRQAQTEMLGFGTNKLTIVAYPLNEESYKNYFVPIDKDKISFFKVERDDAFIDGTLIPNLIELHDCLVKGIFPERN